MAKIQDYYVEAQKYYVEANLRPKNTHNEMKNLLHKQNAVLKLA